MIPIGDAKFEHAITMIVAACKEIGCLNNGKRHVTYHGQVFETKCPDEPKE